MPTVVSSRDLASVAGPAAAALAAVAAVGVVAAVDPNEAGHYPTCPFLAVTGELCPGCGSLRAVHALTRGDLGTAFGLNALTVLSVVPVLLLWALWLRRSWLGVGRRWAAPAGALWGLLGVVLLFWVVRNLSFGAALAP